MGARIAAHLANAGIPCYLLDIAPRELNPEEKRKGLALESPAVRNRIVLAGLDAAKKSRPAAFFTPETARLVTPGNLKTTWHGAAKWIGSSRSSLKISKSSARCSNASRQCASRGRSSRQTRPACRFISIAEGRSEDFQQHWAGTHFFNPPRYMKLVELIPGPKTRPKCSNRSTKFATGGLARASCRERHAEFHRQPHRHVFDAEGDPRCRRSR